MFDIVLMCDEQVTVRAVSTCFIEREESLWLDVDNQRELSLMHLVVALRTLRTAHIPIRIEKEAVTWRLFPKPGDLCLFLFCHGWMISPCFMDVPHGEDVSLAATQRRLDHLRQSPSTIQGELHLKKSDSSCIHTILVIAYGSSE